MRNPVSWVQRDFIAIVSVDLVRIAPTQTCNQVQRPKDGEEVPNGRAHN